MGGNSSDFYLEELTGVIRNKILVESRINQAQNSLAALEDTNPNHAEIENSLMGLTKQLEELATTEAKLRASIIETKFDGRTEFKEPEI